MKLTKENKEHIDSLSHYSLLRHWRFAPVGDKWMEGETGEYWGEHMAELRDENPELAIADSKALGWEG